ncbi:MAG: CZB domain-containing protein [Chromatiaceae bacterium]|nr:CZB domain-containing protein [Chromatiaceae bacterium]
MIYIQHAYRALELGEGSESWNRCMVSPDHCRFGKWYSQGEGAATFSHLPSYPHIDSPHRAVHHCVQHALELAKGDWKQSETALGQILDEFRRIEDRSDELMGLIGGLSVEKQHYEKPSQHSSA